MTHELIALLLAGAALSLFLGCWRHGAALGLICATLAFALALAAALRVPALASSALLGSVLATAIGCVLFILVLGMERLLDD